MESNRKVESKQAQNNLIFSFTFESTLFFTFNFWKNHQLWRYFPPRLKHGGEKNPPTCETPKIEYHQHRGIPVVRIFLSCYLVASTNLDSTIYFLE